MKTITIDVKKWCRGAYLNSYGRMCAVGFAGKQLYGDPEYFSSHRFGKTSSDNGKILTANDDLYGEERRKVLKELFKKAGYRLVFKNL